MRFASVCSGIEAASTAWRPLGWECAWTSEIDPHACSVLAARFPDTPNLGTLIGLSERLTDDERAIDLLVGGTPCQGFSVAGKRGGMDDPRSRLAWEFLGVARVARPCWLAWENVPGCTSTADGRDFGAVLGAMAGLGYGLAWRILDAQFVRVDSHPRAVPQRRRRMFVVGHLGDWRPPVAVLLEPESMRGDSPPRREAGQGVAGTVTQGFGVGGPYPERADMLTVSGTLNSRPNGSGGLGTDFDCNGGVIAEVAPTLNAHFGEKQGLEDQHINGGAGLFVAETLRSHPRPGSNTAGAVVAHTLRAEGHDAGEDGTGRGTPLVVFDTTQITSPDNRCQPASGDPCHPLAAGAHPPAIAFQSAASPSNSMNPSECAPTLDAGKADKMAVAIQSRIGTQKPDAAQNGRGWSGDGAAYTLESGGPTQSVAAGMTVRRLTPLECERLQGFPDHHTAVPHRGKPMADGPRYRLLGNSMAVNVMRWIGERITLFAEMENA